MREVRWTDQWNVGDPVLWISVAKLEAAWRQNSDDYIGPGARTGKPIGERYSRVGEWLAQSSKLWMPVVGPQEDGLPSFTDGRHRFAWLRDHGARAIAVGTDPEDLTLMRRLFGSRSRRTTFRA